MKNIKDIADEDIIALAKMIKTNDWDNSKEVSYWEKYYTEPFYEMYSHCKSYAINCIYYPFDIWYYLTSKGYDIGEFKVRS